LSPDLIVLLDIPVEQGLARKRLKLDVFEREDFLFHHKVRKGYLKMAADDPEHWMVIDATLPEVKIREIIWERVSQLLG
jgi:dTMP kinase